MCDVRSAYELTVVVRGEEDGRFVTIRPALPGCDIEGEDAPAIRQERGADAAVGLTQLPTVIDGGDDTGGHPTVNYRGYSRLSRKLSTRCLSSVAALSS